MPLGSIRNNNINKVNFLKYNKELTYLSVFKTFAHKNSKVKKLNGKLYTQYRQYHKVDKIILNFLKDYCKENKYHLSIIARSFKNDQDIFYEKLKYKKILKNFDWTFIEKQTEDDAYEFIKNKKSYLVNQDCTLGYELLSKYYRVAFFSIRGNVINTHGFNFGWPFKLPDKGNFWTNYPSIKEFKEILNFVVNSSELEWKKEVIKL